MKRTAVAVVLTLALGGCGAAAPLVQQDTPFSENRPEPEQIRLRVDNRNFSDARLYAHGLSKRISLGVVGGKKISVFSVPWTRSEPMRIEIDLLAGPTCTTRSIEVDPGDTLDLQIESEFDRTGLCSRRQS